MQTWRSLLQQKKWLDAGLVAVVMMLTTVGSILEAYPRNHYGGLHLIHHPTVLEFAIVAVPALLLLYRTSRPKLVFCVSILAVAGWSALGQVYGAALVVVLVTTYTLASSDTRRSTVIALTFVGTFSIWLIGGLRGPWGWWGGPQLDMWGEILAISAVGAYVGARRQWKALGALQEQQLERTREEETRQRVDSERLRIARELHDVVAHSMAMINVQATAAAMLLGTDKAKVSEALQDIRQASKEGLRELRSILNVLRQVDIQTIETPVPDHNAFLALVHATGQAGVEVQIDLSAQFNEIPPEVVLAAYRIVQESLTNVIRHGTNPTARVEVTSSMQCLSVLVTNTSSASTNNFSEGSGSGIVGMTERATILGGSLQAGPTLGGGFSVHAALPFSEIKDRNTSSSSMTQSHSDSVKVDVL